MGPLPCRRCDTNVDTPAGGGDPPTKVPGVERAVMLGVTHTNPPQISPKYTCIYTNHALTFTTTTVVEDHMPNAILGYRELTPDEIALINRCKTLGEDIGALITTVRQRPDTDQRAAAIARTEPRTGLMWLIRSIARPEGFG